MNNKAFTLIELLAVIVVLGLLVTITTPNIINAINLSREKAYERQVKLIEEAAERWAIDNMQSNYSKDSISIADLKAEGYLNNDEVKNPKTKKEMSGCIFITKDNSKYKYEYRENCSE